MVRACVQVLDRCKEVLLQCATPDSLARLQHTSLHGPEADRLHEFYSLHQDHSSLLAFLTKCLDREGSHGVGQPLFAQVNTRYIRGVGGVG